MPKGLPHQTAGARELASVQRMLGLVDPSNFKDTVDEPVFVCIDCEAYEFAQQKITEIGVAVLDTRGLAGNGGNSSTIISKMKYAHFRPLEYANLQNRRFVKGCADSFNFGDTTWIKLADASTLLRRLFRHPECLNRIADFDTGLSDELRNVVFVGYNAKSDVSYLSQLGFNMRRDAGLAGTVDTQTLASGSKKQCVSLQRLLLSLGVDDVNLHNGGNDAAYTLRAMVLMAVKDLAVPGSVPVDLAKHAGKLPAPSRNGMRARQVYGGTASRSGQPPAAASSADLKQKRRKHKQDVRKAHTAAGAAAGSKTIITPGQQLLPFLRVPKAPT